MKKWLFIVLLALTAHVVAETNYVDDALVINLRTGQGETFRILRTLRSGTALEILERSDNYTRVRLPDGTEGWVLSQYLTAQPIARDRLIAQQQTLARVESENQRLKKELSALQGEKRSVESEHKQLSGAAEKLQAELERVKATAARPLELEKQNESQRLRLQELEFNLRLLTEENAGLRDRSQREWFLAGAGVLLGGILLGLLLPKLRKRKGWGEWH